MRLEIFNLSKKYNKRLIFDNFSYSFQEKKFYSIIGESGCGKSTLLKILSLQDLDFDGDIKCDSSSYKKMSKREQNDFRLKNFGFVFQNFSLFEEDTVSNNIRIVLDGIVNEKEEVKLKRLEEILQLLEISNLKDSFVKDLSGGEKQRVAIARAMVSSPEIIFCDEPTGSLDETNTKNVFEILKVISSYTTVILVTHDRENAEKYSDDILEFSRENIRHIFHEKEKTIEKMQIMQLSKKKREGILSKKFIFAHFKNLGKNRKIRNLIKNLLFSLSLISCGLAITLTNSLNDSISSSFSSIVSTNEVVLTKKNSNNELYDYYSAPNSAVQNLMAHYSMDINRYGVNYLVDFENYFIDENILYSVNKTLKNEISGFTARHFNEFIYLDEDNSYEIYPKLESPLKDDEIIISITFDQMKSMCLELQILRDFEFLGNYLKENDYFVSLELANYSWEYTDEQLFKVKGVIFDNKNRVYHTNTLFNEVLFEEQMRFPTSNRPNKIEEYPWMFKKVYYVETREFQNILLNKLFYDERYKDYIFEIDSEEYRPLTYEQKNNKNYIYVFNAFKDAVDVGLVEIAKQNGLRFKNYYYSTNAGYYNNGTSIFTGFNNPTFFSLYEEDLNQIIDAYSRVNVEEIYNIETPKNVVNGFALNPASNNLKFKTIEEPLSIKEIVISGGFAEILNKNNIKNTEIFATMLVNSELNGGILDTTFRTIKLTIKDIVEEDKSVSIYQNKDYTISLFRDLFRISSFRLIPNSIIFETEEKVDEKSLEKLNSLFADYEFKNPMLEIENSIEESTKFLTYILYGFSLVSIISSIILSLIISYINALEEVNEIKLLKTLGFNNFQILKMFFCDNFLQSGICILTSLISLIFINFFVSKAIGNMIGLGNVNVFSPLAIISIFLVAGFIILISTTSVNKVLKKAS